MRPVEEYEKVLNMYFHEGKGYKQIAKALHIPLNTVKSWCYRYRLQNNIPQRDQTTLAREPLTRIVKPKNEDSQEARIARLEMEVDLLRNFLILTDGR